MPRRFPPPWTVEQIPGGYVVKDASGQSLAYVYARETKAKADTAKVPRWTKRGALRLILLNCQPYLDAKRINTPGGWYGNPGYRIRRSEQA